MSRPYIINISSDEEEDDDLEVLEFHQATQKLIEQAPPKVVKKLCEAECPICFDTIKNATTTFCGHVYCLECLQKSVAASSARGQTKGKKGVGLCPMCRKTVAFKETVVLRLKKGQKVVPPNTKTQSKSDVGNSTEESSKSDNSDDEFVSFGATPSHDNNDAFSHTDEELAGLF
ncbi:hypothetical protein JCM33374_g5932 [Metschnikowia sp. JCM 33374]|nr:hypothetical protein JCM33374_g5932 [Metschnikowia sp. JCM 33374]